MISIVIPTLNEEIYLPRLINSIKKQDYLDYEIIVSDGGSSDKTPEIAREMGCVFISDNTHHHPSWQRNGGANIARGELILFLDADTVLQENFLSLTISEFIKRNLDVAAFYVKFNPNRPLYSFFGLVVNGLAWFRQLISPIGIGAGIIVKNEINKKINGFDTEILLAEDYDYCTRSAKIGKFRMIRSIKLLYSSRRLENDGEFTTLFKWLKMGLFTLLNIKIKKKIVEYDFGKFKK
jgi:glycosyltransferase involved in cell wall biosynthesis